MSDRLAVLDQIAAEAFNGSYERAGVLTERERFYVALASGRMRELCPDDHVTTAACFIGRDWFDHMLARWGECGQPSGDN